MKERSPEVRGYVLCALFAALITVGAHIKVPVPIVPFTLQFLFTTLAGLTLGPKRGALAVLVYIAAGLAGFPVFTSGGGPAYVMQPTFGYLPGFAAGAWITGYIAERRGLSYANAVLASFAGLAAVYSCGMGWCWAVSNYVLGTPIALKPLFVYCFLLAVPGDAALCFISAAAAVKLCARSALANVRS